MFASIEEDAHYDTYDRDFLWLVNAGVAHMVRQATEAKSPLRRTEVAGRFKLYQSDTGMLLSRYPQATARAVYLDRRDQNLGGIYENAVAQGLSAANVPLWYFASQGVGEMDFLMQGAHGRVVPIEVRSGRKVRSHAALDRLLRVGEYRIRDAIVLSRNNVSQEGPVLYAPIYMTYIASCGGRPLRLRGNGLVPLNLAERGGHSASLRGGRASARPARLRGVP